ncbi:GNAT family N-acetyltransferase [Pseudoxanthomonas wuyuanensis]|uniref:Acetyltransferase (GNAT) family protein n=1 Tax=Pseudoxanthomonas wuyuanensis TaxID=1073196 RepID=A0A286CYE8_9GAMM|nr:GNAT family N-acetyltransferase [Pseudoxanthomonas wuyuanensis]KAF1722735.1 N-acetyltransferase [Pseudoxanthomonas wuyuanensis]SOD51431.1 Acetyltransferase (GNAT) family protein [Pseudoxanthomonas wuyuanensis]
MLRFSTDPADLDVVLIHDFLGRHSYWAAGIPRPTLERALANSLCIGGYLGERQVAFARAVTDQATFAYIADVFVLDEFRGQGHGRAIVQALLADPRLQGLRRMHLVTRDMHQLYRGLGFSELAQPEQHMQKHDPDVYRRPTPA